MKRYTKRLLIAATAAGVLGTTAVAWARGGECGADNGPRAEHMQKKIEQRQTQLKEALKLNASQENAWKEYSAAMQTSKGAGLKLDRAEWDKLTTPQRMEKMQSLRSERESQMTQRLEAMKKFYAALTPEQQKAFDQQHQRMDHHGEHKGGRHDEKHGHHHG